MIRGPMINGHFNYYTDEVFEAEFGLNPRLWIEVLALQGDNSDNIPGVRNIGHKRALQLVSRYGRIENIFDQISEAWHHPQFRCRVHPSIVRSR